MRPMFFLALAAYYSLTAFMIDDAKKPCTHTEASQFDFWEGEWDLSWVSKDGKTQRGTNTITKILGGCVIKEEFVDEEGDLTGMSVSIYEPQTNMWKQTWVDNRGSYLDFTGGFNNGRMVLSRKATRDGKMFLQRMQWYNIASHSMDWNWERSDDNGKTWSVIWKIQYTRKGGAQ